MHKINNNNKVYLSNFNWFPNFKTSKSQINPIPKIQYPTLTIIG